MYNITLKVLAYEKISDPVCVAAFNRLLQFSEFQATFAVFQKWASVIRTRYKVTVLSF